MGIVKFLSRHPVATCVAVAVLFLIVLPPLVLSRTKVTQTEVHVDPTYTLQSRSTPSG